MKMTPWYPGHVKPVRKGVYMVVFWNKEKLSYCYWNGTNWADSFSGGSSLKNIYSAYRHTRGTNSRQNMEWRGVKK